MKPSLIPTCSLFIFILNSLSNVILLSNLLNLHLNLNLLLRMRVSRGKKKKKKKKSRILHIKDLKMSWRPISNL